MQSAPLKNRAETLEQLARLCRREGVVPARVEPSGTVDLDAILPGGGWQSGTIVELMPAQVGIGELSLLMPALARITASESHIAFIAPPYIPYAPALTQRGVQVQKLLVIRTQSNDDTLWAAEQTLRCRSFGAVVAWPVSIRDREVRRLQLAAEAGRSIGFIYRTTAAALETSPAAVRLKLQREDDDRLQIDVVKCRGTRSGFSICVPVVPASQTHGSTSLHVDRSDSACSLEPSA